MNSTLVQQAYEHIRCRLMDGRIDADARISMNAISKELGISRTPVRDAVSRLAAEGILTPLAKSGVVLRSLSFRELREYVQLRYALETYASGLAAKQIQSAQREKLRSLCRKMRKLSRTLRDREFDDAPTARKLQLADAEFHRVILQTCGNRKIQKTVEDHDLLMRKVRYPSQPTAEGIAKTLYEHWRIYRALASGSSAQAKRAMRRHAKRGGRAILQSYLDHLER